MWVCVGAKSGGAGGKGDRGGTVPSGAEPVLPGTAQDQAGTEASSPPRPSPAPLSPAGWPDPILGERNGLGGGGRDEG